MINDHTMAPNDVILLEADNKHYDFVANIKDQYEAILIHNKQRIKLNVLKILTGEVVTQVLLKPSNSLTIGATYKLKILGLYSSKQELLKDYNYLTKNHQPPLWVVKNKTEDNIAPKWLQKPKLIESINSPASGGYEFMWANFEVKTIDQSQVFFETEVVDLLTGKIQKLFLTTDHFGKLMVGSGKCAGLIFYEPNRKYKVRFKPMDMCGNYGEVSDWITFDSPVIEK